MEFIDKIFFYGSLKSDGPFYSMYSKNVLYMQSSYTKGRMTLYQETFPALVDEPGYYVYGELATIFNVRDVLMVLDNVEKYLDRVVKTVWVLPENQKASEDSEPKAVKSWVYIYKGSREKLAFLDIEEWDNAQLKL